MPVSKAFDDAMKAGKIQLSLKGHLACLRYDLKNVGIDLGYIAKYFKEKISRWDILSGPLFTRGRDQKGNFTRSAGRHYFYTYF